MRAVSRDGAVFFPADVIHDDVLAVFKAAQFNCPFPVLSEKGVVHRLIFADCISFRQIEANVIDRFLLFFQHHEELRAMIAIRYRIVLSLCLR
jgi:hypothetical protein